MCATKTNFIGIITFDASSGHAGIISKLEQWGFKKKSLHNRDLPNNTYLGKFSLDAETNSSGNFITERLKKVCDNKSDYYRGELNDYFNENDIDGRIYVFFSWEPVSDDSMTN